MGLGDARLGEWDDLPARGTYCPGSLISWPPIVRPRTLEGSFLMSSRALWILLLDGMVAGCRICRSSCRLEYHENITRNGSRRVTKANRFVNDEMNGR